MKRVERSASDGILVDPEGKIVSRTWSPEVLRRHIKGWDTLDDGQKIKRIRQLDDSLAERVDETHNIALDGLIELIPAALNPITSSSATTSHLAFGTSTDDPQPGGDSLGNEIYRTIVGDADTDGNDLLVSAILSQTEANGYTITEIGLAGGPDQEDDPLLTHAPLQTGNEVEKNTKMVVTFDYVLEFRRPNST